ncbi:MAG: RNase A-like domain-containing protein [Lachnospiraceae bacterium]
MITLSEQFICEYIKKNIEKWLFTGHVAEFHLNASGEELLNRIGKYHDGKLINRASSFLDTTDGDDIIEGLCYDIQSRSKKILNWLEHSDNDLIALYFDKLPANVSGIVCSIYRNGIYNADGYYVLLCKNEQYPFYLLNAYPVLMEAFAQGR